MHLILNINLIAEVSSIISVIISFILIGITLFINNKIKKINNKLLFNKRIPELLIDLNKNKSNLSKLLGMKGNEREYKKEISLAIISIESIKQKISGNSSKAIPKTLEILKQAQAIDFKLKRRTVKYFGIYKHHIPIKEPIDNIMWNCYNGINSVIYEIKNIYSDISQKI